jgi:hypothetical protein
MLPRIAEADQMFRALLRLLLVVAILSAAAAFFLGYRLGDAGFVAPASASTPTVDVEKAREAGASSAEQIISEGQLTAKIKSKMVLDDTVRARMINVDTRGTVVTLSGTVQSEIERATALELARDTVGVTSVVDRMVVR